MTEIDDGVDLKGIRDVIVVNYCVYQTNFNRNNWKQQ